MYFPYFCLSFEREGVEIAHWLDVVSGSLGI